MAQDGVFVEKRGGGVRVRTSLGQMCADPRDVEEN